MISSTTEQTAVQKSNKNAPGIESHTTRMNAMDTTIVASVKDSGLPHWKLLPETIHTVELILAVSIFIAIHSLRQRRRLGLTSWPLVGMLPSLFLGLRHDMYDWITGVLVERGGTFTFSGPWLTNLHCVITADPRNLEHLLKEKFASFPKGPYFRATVQDLLGGGIFAADDEAWRRQRKTASLEFHSAEFRSMTARSLVELVHGRLLPVLDEAAAGGHVDQGKSSGPLHFFIQFFFEVLHEFMPPLSSAPPSLTSFNFPL